MDPERREKCNPPQAAHGSKHSRPGEDHDGEKEWARKERAREELARGEWAKEEHAREERAREDWNKEELAREKRAREARIKEERAREGRVKEDRAKEERAMGERTRDDRAGETQSAGTGLERLGRLFGLGSSGDQRSQNQAGQIRELEGWGYTEEDPVQAAETQIRKLQNQLHVAGTQIGRLQNQLQDAASHVRSEQHTSRQLHQQVQLMESERETMSLRIKSLEAQIREVQARAFEGIAGDSWAAGDDNTVRAELESLQRRAKAWAKKYAIEDLADIDGLPLDERESLVRFLAQVVRLRPNAQNPLEHLASGPMKKKSPVMCLQGLLTHHVYANIISRPFFVLGSVGETLQTVCTSIRKGETLSLLLAAPPPRSRRQHSNPHRLVDEGESHLWRSKTLRLLATPPPNTQQCDGALTYHTSQTGVCRAFGVEFYNSPVRHLIAASHKAGAGDADEPSTPCLADLDALMQQAGELASRLWSRRTALGTRSLAELSSEPFTIRSPLIKAHPLHRLYDDDARCDGWSVSVVTHPAVLGFGSGDGRDYSTPRVWTKGEVWLTEKI